jgi:hypothetical protein
MDEKFDHAKHFEGGLVVTSDGSDAPIVVCQPPEAVHHGRLPARTGSARRDGSLCPMGAEGLEVGAPPPQQKLEKEQKADEEWARAKEQKTPTILGIRRNRFFVILIAALVIIGIVVGGAVGGTRRSRQNANSTSKSVPPPITRVQKLRIL